MRTALQRYNAAHQVPEAIDRGYHETITQAWMRLVDFVLRKDGPNQTADEFYEQHPELWQMKILRLFYSRDVLMSGRFKAEYVPADLTPLPNPDKAVDFIAG